MIHSCIQFILCPQGVLQSSASMILGLVDLEHNTTATACMEIEKPYEE